MPTPPPGPTPAITISVTPATITLGQSAVLTWSTVGVSTCTASGAWSGPQNPAGSTKVTPATTGSFAYVLNCSVAPAGSIAQSATLTVKAMGAASSAHHFMPARQRVRVLRTDLVTDVAGSGARITDGNFSEPWGLVLADNSGAVVANRQGHASTSYDGMGNAAVSGGLLRLPPRAESGGTGSVSVVANPGDGFVISTATRSAPARLLYAAGGTIAAWSPEVDGGHALVRYVANGPADYTGLAIATSSTPGESRLYAADFRNARVDVLDESFRKQTPTRTRFAFSDPALPPGYAPFGIAWIDDLVYVAYAQAASATHEAVTGIGAGLIEVFTPGGDFITRLVDTGGALNAPWAMTKAPAGADFPFERALLVGNTGDGHINAFDLETGTLLGSLGDARGAALVIPGLHGLAFGNDYASQPRGTLFFTAGAQGAVHGWYGRLDLVVAPETPAR